MTGSRVLLGISLLVIVTFAIAAILTLFPFTIDDAFISLRYAKHLADGNGLLWNIQGEPVEGYSNLLWVLIASLGFFLQLPTLLLMKLLGVAALFLSVLALYQLSREFLPPMFSLLSAMLLLMHRGEWIWAVSGLETTLFQLLLIVAMTLVLKGLKKSKPSYFIGASILWCLLTMLRIEALGLFALTCVLMLCYWHPRQQLRSLVSFVLPYVGFIVPLFLWRYHTFQRLFPNSVYCKALFSSVPGHESFLYLKLMLPFVIFFVVLFYQKNDRRYWFLLLPSVLYLIGFIHADVVVSFDYRYFLPVFVLLLPLFVLSIKTCVELVFSYYSANRQAVLTILICLFMGFVALPKSSIGQMQYFAKTNVKAQQFRKNIAMWINNNYKASDKIALGDCGLIPYTSDRRFVDTYCLNSKKMTSKAINLSYPSYVNWLLYDEKPSLIILLALVSQHTAYHPPFDIELFKRADFLNHYKKVNVFKLGTDSAGYRYEVYERFSVKA